MTEVLDMTALGRRMQAARETAEISQTAAGTAIGVSQPTYSRIEKGERPLAGDELVVLADLFGVRAASITGLASVSKRAIYAARTDGSSSAMEKMRARLSAYLELAGYLTDQGID